MFASEVPGCIFNMFCIGKFLVKWALNLFYFLKRKKEKEQNINQGDPRVTRVPLGYATGGYITFLQ